MRQRIFHKKIAFSWACSLLMYFTATAMADDYSYHPMSLYMQLAADSPSTGRQTNPWQLPERQRYRPDFQQSPDYPAQQYQNGQQNLHERRQGYQQYPGYQRQQEQNSQFGNQGEAFRFVTPDILESLKQQQTQTQKVPENEQAYHYGQQRYGGGYYGYPSYGLGSGYPLFNAPAISPWGSASDLLYQGNSFPWVPDAAIGGWPGLHMSPPGELEGLEKQQQYNVFDPFSLLPNAN